MCFLFRIRLALSTPLQYSRLENPMDGGAWWATVHGVTKSQTRLSDFISLAPNTKPIVLKLWVISTPPDDLDKNAKAPVLMSLYHCFVFQLSEILVHTKVWEPLH